MEMEKTHKETTHNTHWTNIQVLLENCIAYQNQTLSSEKLQDLLLSLKAQKTQDDSWFNCKQVYEMPLRTLPESVVYQGQGEKEKVLPGHRYKKTRILPN